MFRTTGFAALAALLALTGCKGGQDDRVVTAEDANPYDGIAADETIIIGGTEPFWGGTISGQTLTYTTPEDPDGQTITVRRFAGMNGLGFSGTLEDKALDLAVTPGSCSDGMSDRTYPFTATLRIGTETRNGCAHTDRQGFTGPENP